MAFLFLVKGEGTMSPARTDEPRQTRATVLTMPSRGPQPAPRHETTSPPPEEHSPGDEPGYGHGV